MYNAFISPLMISLWKYLKAGVFWFSLVALGNSFSGIGALALEDPKKTSIPAVENKYKTKMVYINDGQVILRNSESDSRIIATGDDAKWSDKGKSILITSNNKILKYDLDKKVLEPSKSEWNKVVSPDGLKYFIVNSDNFSVIHDPSRPYSYNDFRGKNPRWVDGRHFIYEYSNSLILVDTSEKGLYKPVEQGMGFDLSPDKLISYGLTKGPLYVNDFAKENDASHFETALHILNLKTGEDTRLFKLKNRPLPQSGSNISQPSRQILNTKWAPNGEKVAYTINDASSTNMDVIVYDLFKLKATKVLDDIEGGKRIHWLEDSQNLVISNFNEIIMIYNIETKRSHSFGGHGVQIYIE